MGPGLLRVCSDGEGGGGGAGGGGRSWPLRPGEVCIRSIMQSYGFKCHFGSVHVCPVLVSFLLALTLVESLELQMPLSIPILSCHLQFLWLFCLGESRLSLRVGT